MDKRQEEVWGEEHVGQNELGPAVWVGIERKRQSMAEGQADTKAWGEMSSVWAGDSKETSLPDLRWMSWKRS